MLRDVLEQRIKEKGGKGLSWLGETRCRANSDRKPLITVGNVNFFVTHSLRDLCWETFSRELKSTQKMKIHW